MARVVHFEVRAENPAARFYEAAFGCRFQHEGNIFGLYQGDADVRG